MKSPTAAESSLGRFTIAPDLELPGRLVVAGRDTSLHVWSEEPFDFEDASVQVIEGTLNDGTKVSLVNCIVTRQSSELHARFGRPSFVEFFPNYVISGRRHLCSCDEVVCSVSFVTDGAPDLFTDCLAFDLVPTSADALRDVLVAHETGRDVKIGATPWLVYYTGQEPLFSSTTAIGRVSAAHRPSFNSPSRRGVHLRSKTVVTVECGDPIDILEAQRRMHQVLRFLELVLGRAQSLEEITVSIESGDVENELEVRPSMIEMVPRYSGATGSTMDLLLDAARKPEEFSAVLAAWLERDAMWRTARVDFSRNWSMRNHYDPSRAVRAANIFDLIPLDVFPSAPPVPSDVVDAAKEARASFKQVTKGAGRDMVLNTLGRVGTWTLKERIRHRASILVGVLGERILDIETATDEAVNCRNQYVHGTKARVDADAFAPFLTQTLEFVFGASDLVEAGWDLAGWCSEYHHPGHPFGRYLMEYEAKIRELKCALSRR